MNPILEQISKVGIVPVIKLNDPSKAVPLVTALKKGGIPVAEVTFRAAGAAKAIELMTKARPDMLVGAGTVLCEEQVDEAIAAGAKFIVSPGLDTELVKYCQKKGIAIFPGCTSPTDYHAAYRLGLKVLKFFPAEQSGGLEKIKAMSAPYGNVKFMPTGGINLKNVADYLGCKAVYACGGSWMVKGDMIAAGEFDKIKEMTAEAVALVKEIRG